MQGLSSIRLHCRYAILLHGFCQVTRGNTPIGCQSDNTFIFSILIALRRVADRGSTSPVPLARFALLCATNSSATPPYSSIPSTPRPKTKRRHVYPRHTPCPFGHEGNSPSPNVPKYTNVPKCNPGTPTQKPHQDQDC